MKKKKTGKKKKKRGRTALIIALAAFAALLAAGLFTGNFLYNFALNAARRIDYNLDGKPRAEGEAPGPVTTGGGEQIGMEGLFSDPEWIESAGAEDVWITSDDGLRLHALEIDDFAAGPWIVLIHGYSSNAESMASFAKKFYARGYNILMPDLRGHGESDGTYRGMGWDDRLDILLWLDRIVANAPDCEIAMYGISMGGATVMMTAGEPMPGNVKALIEDCGYSSVYREFSYQLKNIFRLPPVPFMQFADIVTRIRAGSDLIAAGSSVKQLEKCVTPMLFIHGTADTFVPYAMLDEVYEAAACEKEKFVVEGAIHGMSFATDPDGFWAAIDGFLGKYIG